MAKELAQTIGGKKIGLLLAILAAFAVLATMGNQIGSKDARAEVNPDPNLSCTAGPFTGGDSITCSLEAGTNTAGDFTTLITVPDSVSSNTSTCDRGENSGAETIGPNSLSCLSTGPTTGDDGDGDVFGHVNSQYVGEFAAQPNCEDDVSVTITGVATDSESDSESDTEQVLIETPCLTVDKYVTLAGGSCTLPCAGFYTVLIENSNLNVDATGVGFIDELDDRLVITSVTENSAVGSCTYVNEPAPIVTCSGLTVPSDGNIEVIINWLFSSSDIPLGQPLGNLVENGLEDNGVSTCVTSDNVAGEVCDPATADPNEPGLDDAAFLFAGSASASLTKESSLSHIASAPVPGTFDWIFQIKNTGTVPLTQLTLVDDQLDGGSTFLSADVQAFTGSIGNGACVVTSGTPGALTCNFAAGTGIGDASPILQLNPGESITIVVHMRAVLNAPDGTNIFNDAEFDALEISAITSSGTVEIDNDPVLSITKTLTGGPTVGFAGGGDPAAFVIAITNSGAVAATGVSLTDVMPAGLTVTSVTGAGCQQTGNGVTLVNNTIAANTTITCTVNIELAAAVLSELTSFVNTASLDADILPSPITASASVQAAVPALSVSKSSSGTVSSSQNVTYTITVTNTGNGLAQNVDITDSLPAGLTLVTNTCPAVGGFTTTGDDCLNGTIAAGASATQTIVASLTLPTTLVDGTVLTNSVVVTADNTAGALDSADTTVLAPKLQITKEPTHNPVSGTPAENFSWIITVSNIGSQTATAVTLTDTTSGADNYDLVAGTYNGCVTTATGIANCALGNIAPASSVTIVIPAVSKPAADGTSGDNTANANCTNCPNAVSATANVTTDNDSVLDITKTDGLTHIIAGSNTTYTITVTNSGAGSQNVIVRDTLPGASVTYVSTTCPGNPAPVAGVLSCPLTVAGNSSVSFTVTVNIPVGTPLGTVVVNTASLVDLSDNEIAVATDTTIVQNGALTVTKTNSPTTIGQNGVVTSTIVVHNLGNSTLTNVAISDLLPAGTTYVVSGSSANCSQTVVNPVICTDGTLAAGSSVTFIVKFNVGTTSGVITNTVTASGNNANGPVPVATAQASVTVVPQTGGGLVHVDVDAAAESAAHGSANDANQILHDPGSSELQKALADDNDDATGSLHTVCLISATLGLNDQNDIVWSILPTPGSLATVSPAGGTKSIRTLTDIFVVNGNQVWNDAEANCVSWRSAGVGGQTITATHTISGKVYFLIGSTDTPLVKQWNDIDSTKIVSVLGNLGSTIFGNTQDLASWTSRATGSTCVRDFNVSATDVNCVDFANVDGTTTDVAGSSILVGGNAGNIVAGNKSFIEYAFGNHVDYAGPIDGVKQTFTNTGTCGTVAVENPVTGAVVVLEPGESVTILNSDKGVGFQIFPYDDNGVYDCSPGEFTTVTISSAEDVQLRSDLDTAPTETVSIRWVIAPPPQKQILLAWAGQRVILEHDWRISDTGQAYDVTATSIPAAPAVSVVCPIPTEGRFRVHYIRGTGPGNFLPSLGAEVLGNDDAQVFVDTRTDQENDNSDIASGNENCISRVLYESEDPGEVDIEAFIDGNSSLNLSKIAFVVYYMKFESIDLSIVSQQAKPYHNAPSLATFNAVAPYDWGDYFPGNPWDAAADDADGAVDWNVSKDLLLRVRVKGWFNNSNPSGRLADATNALNVLPANRWVMPDDWDLLAGGPTGEEVKGTAEDFRPGYDLMMAPNNKGLGSGLATDYYACDTPVGGCSETLGSVLTGTAITSYTQTYNITAPVEGPYSLLDLVGPLSAALSNFNPLTVRNTIIRDRDIDWWDAPMPAAIVSVDLRQSGFLKQVFKEDVYWVGTTNGHYGTIATGGQDFTNPYYISNVPESAFIPAVAAGGGFLWNSFGPDGVGGLGQGVYDFWTALPQFLGYGKLTTDASQANTNHGGVADNTLTTTLRNELAQIRVAYGALHTDANIRAEARSIGRALVVFTDNHGEAMVQANGDFNLTYADCDTNVFGGGKHCAQGDKVGTSSIVSTVDYPDFRGKHFPVKSNSVTVTWTWGGYKEVTIENGETDQFKYIVFHALDRDGFCAQTLPGSVSLHPVLSSWDALWTVGANDPVESVDFLIDSGEGIIVGQSGGGTINDGKQFAIGVPTFYTGASTTDKDFARANGSTEECQAWIRVSNSLLGILNVLSTAHDDEGDIGFDRIIDFSSSASYSLTFRWSLITWAGKNGISPSDALKGTVGTGANNIFDKVTAVYGWNQASQTWLGFFPAGVSVPGANDLTALNNGSAYWIAIKGPDAVTWTIGTNVN